MSFSGGDPIEPVSDGEAQVSTLAWGLALAVLFISLAVMAAAV